MDTRCWADKGRRAPHEVGTYVKLRSGKQQNVAEEAQVIVCSKNGSGRVEDDSRPQVQVGAGLM